MKISAQEEYGLRILLRIARSEEGVCISEISTKELVTHHNVAKLCRLLRMLGYIDSTRGHTGGYFLAVKPEDIRLDKLLKELGGALYDENFCSRFTSQTEICTHSIDCTVRTVWKVLQEGVDGILSKITLRDLVGPAEGKVGDCGQE